MKLLSIHGGLFARVDDSDFERLSEFNWHLSRRKKSSFYVARTKYLGSRRSTKVYLHREIMQPPEGKIVDHIDRDVLNNQRSNLRICTYSQNNCNLSPRKNVSSRFKGVSFCNTYKKWLAVLSYDGKELLRKKYDTELEAVRSYNSACLKHHGEFALPNII